MNRIICILLVPAYALIVGCTQHETDTAGVTKTASGASGLRVENTDRFDAGMHKVLQTYIVIQQALAADTLDGIAAAARDAQRHLDAVQTQDVTGPDAPRYVALVDSARGPARALGGTKDLVGARAHFKELSRSLVPWLNTARLPGYDLVWCSMAPGGWAQKSGPIRNPYYGASMLECGEKVARP